MHIGTVICMTFLDKCPLPSLLSSVFNHSLTAINAFPDNTAFYYYYIFA